MINITPTAYPPKKAKLETGVNHLLTLFPLIAGESVDIDPSKVLVGSTKKVSWKCSLCGDVWQAAPKSRTSMFKPSVGCAVCSRKIALEKRGKRKTLFDTFPELANELLNIDDAKHVTQSSHKIVTWVCNRGHEYELSVNKRFYGRGCPFCAFREVMVGFNDLGAVRPDLIKQLVNPQDAGRMANDNEKIDWFHVTDDEIRHEWKASCKDRVYLGCGCTVCVGRSVQVGVNDFKSQFLDSSVYTWSDKNSFSPNEIVLHSHTKIYLDCLNHSSVNNMYAEARYFVTEHTKCQDCKPKFEKFVSKAENEIVEFICSFVDEDLVEQSVRRFKSKGVFEIDILADNKVAIDFNGTYWHQEGVFKPVGYHAAKRKAVESLGFVFIEVEEADWNKNKKAIRQNIAREVLNAK